MDNYAIADQLSLLSKLMDIHGENSFKAKSYASAAFALEKLPNDITTLPKEKIYSIRGIGESVGNKIIEIIETRELEALKELIAKTPEGILEMMNIKGLGPKKINTLWKELNISTISELREACEQNKIAATKGFGEKTQQSILASINFQQENKGKYLYAQIDAFAQSLLTKLAEKFSTDKIEISGAYRRQLEVIEELEFVTTIQKDKLLNFFHEDEYNLISDSEKWVEILANDAVKIKFHLTVPDSFASTFFNTSGSNEFLLTFKNSYQFNENENYKDEEDIFTRNNLQYIPPFLREKESILIKAKEKKLVDVIQTSDIKGLIHSHSNWSDGAYTIEQMAEELIRLRFDYLVISDHSKAAFYANGLSEQKIKEQHKYIDELNKKFAPFKIFKSIECDILADGVMDYSNDVLSTFDLVIASIHSNLDIPEEKAMKRLLGAIINPYVTILGHMTGRILLRRKGYPVNYKEIIDACKENNVVIEINASPSRLDMDWRWIDYALEKNVILSINPDAHSLDEFESIRWGVAVAQKGGLTKQNNLSSYSLQQFENFLAQNKSKKALAYDR